MYPSETYAHPLSLIHRSTSLRWGEDKAATSAVPSSNGQLMTAPSTWPERPRGHGRGQAAGLGGVAAGPAERSRKALPLPP